MKWYKVKAEFWKKKKSFEKRVKAWKQKLKGNRPRLETKFELWLLSKGYKRQHCWPLMNANAVEYFRYKKAVESCSYFCYWNPVGWLPWSGFFISRRYKSYGPRPKARKTEPE